MLIALIVFVALDYVTGVMCAVVDKKLSSAVGFKGIFKKVLIFALVGVGHILDTHVIGSGGAMRTARSMPNPTCWLPRNHDVSVKPAGNASLAINRTVAGCSRRTPSSSPPPSSMRAKRM